MRAGRSSAPRRAQLLCLAAIFAALALGWLLGHSGSKVQRGSASSPSEATGGRAEGPRHSPKGAATAVASFQGAFASPSILRPGELRRRIEAVATPGYVAQMLEANAPGRDRIAAGPIGQGLVGGAQTLYAAVPIGYRIEAYNPHRARVLTWGFTLLGNATEVEPAAYFGLTHTELVWTEEGWRIAETEGGFGPSPRLATPPGPLGSYDVIGLAARLKSYELAP